MRFRTFFAIAVMVGLSGCATKLVTSKADMGNFKQDNYACVQESRTTYGGAGIMFLATQYDAQKLSTRLYRMCMEARGYAVEER